jgi:hypothetical protein
MQRVFFVLLFGTLLIASCSPSEPAETPPVTVAPKPAVTEAVGSEDVQEVPLIGWPRYLIAKNHKYAQSVDNGDIDGDGDLDIAATSFRGNKLSWWQNNGGAPIDWQKASVAFDFLGAHQLTLVDMDQDGMLDVLGIGYNIREIAWWRNDGGAEKIKWEKETIATNFGFALEAYAADFDADGDLDIVGASEIEVAWWRNDGGEPTVWTKSQLKQLGFWPVRVGDLDGDGDIDIVGGVNRKGIIWWWENLSDEGASPESLFAEHLITENYQGIPSLDLNDVDGDGDLDILAVDTYGDLVIFISNEGGDPLEWSEAVIASEFDGAQYVTSGDLDNDGDVDVIAVGYLSNEAYAWFNQGGDPISWEEEVVGVELDEVQGASLGDFDGDGDLDLVVAVAGLDDVIWFENVLE